MTRKVYVACSSTEIHRASGAIAAVRELGGEITFDWTIPVSQHGSEARDLPIHAVHAEMCNALVGVREADVVVLLDGDFSYGRTVEIGAALMNGTPIVASGRALGRIWETGEHARFPTDEAAIRYAMEMPL